jgi:hypothetical protein
MIPVAPAAAASRQQYSLNLRAEFSCDDAYDPPNGWLYAP